MLCIKLPWVRGKITQKQTDDILFCGAAFCSAHMCKFCPCVPRLPARGPSVQQGRAAQLCCKAQPAYLPLFHPCSCVKISGPFFSPNTSSCSSRPSGIKSRLLMLEKMLCVSCTCIDKCDFLARYSGKLDAAFARLSLPDPEAESPFDRRCKSRSTERRLVQTCQEFVLSFSWYIASCTPGLSTRANRLLVNSFSLVVAT